jgi:hypothetical protein
MTASASTVAFAIGHRVEALPCEAGHPSIFLLRCVGELTQPLRRADALRGGHARLRVLGRERELKEQGFLANCGDRAAAPIRIPGAARHVGADGIGAGLGIEPCHCLGAVLRFGKHDRQRGGEGGGDGGVGFAVPGGGECAETRATVGSGDATSGAGSMARSAASSSDSGGNSTAPMTRCAASAC